MNLRIILPCLAFVSVALADEPPPGFKAIFNGKDFTGWNGEPGRWSVEDGAITGTVAPENPLKTNSFLVWQGGEKENFELRMKVRWPKWELSKGFRNSGIQIRSVVLPAVHPWSVGGYQYDLSPGGELDGSFYEERSQRGLGVAKGDRVVIQPDGERWRVATLDRIAILLREPTLKALDEPLRTYVADVEQRFPVKLQVIAHDWKTPQEVRETIKTLRKESAITGVVLVGAMPMHLFFMHEHPNPNPLYYEDFDLPFVDNNKDGVDDAYQGKPELKLWVANIRATEKAKQDDIPELRRFFAKTHDYYTGKVVPELRTLLFSSDVPTEDWAGSGDWFKRRGGARFSTPEKVTVLEGKGCTHKALLEAFKKHSYSLTCVALHSDETGHALYDGDLMAHEIADFKTGSLITISHGCFAANWTKTEHDNNGPNCGLSWVFSKHLGQALVGQVRSGGVGFDNLIYERLRAGDYLGKAYLPCKQAHEIEHAMGDHVPGDIVSGILMIGNPFLELKPVKREAKARLVIRNAVYGDLATNAVVNVTQKVADWTEDGLPVRATADDFGDPANGIEKQLKVDYTLDGVEKTITIEEGQLLKFGK